MMRWNALFLAGLLCAGVAACTSPQDATSLEPPDLLEQLSNADLTPSPSGPQRSQVEYASGPWAGTVAQTYPGNDAVVAEGKKRTPPAQGVARGTNGYELNFADAELSELAKVILRDTLGLAYIFDPRVQGRVTVSTGGRCRAPRSCRSSRASWR
jgi:general secretion pathway protein D